MYYISSRTSGWFVAQKNAAEKPLLEHAIRNSRRQAKKGGTYIHLFLIPPFLHELKICKASPLLFPFGKITGLERKIGSKKVWKIFNVQFTCTL